jgi:glycosyltransferase involved in cell wall biosynthesis
MRVAVLGSRHILSGYSGVERGLMNFLPHLAERGHEITIFSDPRAVTAEATATGEDRWCGIRSVTVPALRGKHTETLTRTALAMPGVLTGRFDVALFTHQGPGIFCPVARAAGAAAVVWVQGLDWQRAKWSPFAGRAIRGAEQVAVHSADGLVVASRRIQRYFADTYRREATYIPGGIGRTPPPATIGYLERLGVRPGGYLLFAARLVPEKACHELIEAWQQVETDKVLIIAGGGSPDDPYVRRLHAMTDPARVIFAGHIGAEPIAELFANAYAFVLPSHLEGQSVALLEALGARRAVLVSDIPENLEAIEPGGFTFRVGDVTDLRAKLAWLIADEDAVHRMEAQVSRAIEHWPDWKAVALLHEAAYAEAIARRTAGRSRRGSAQDPSLTAPRGPHGTG